MPDITTPPEEWGDKVAAVAAWATPKEIEAAADVEFGCIIGREATGKSRFLPWWLWSLVTERDPDTLLEPSFCGSLEFASQWHGSLVHEARARQPQPRHELAIGSYTAVGRMLQGNVTGLDPEDPYRKGQDGAEASWCCISDNLTLPARVVLIVDIEPAWPASLAFLLTAALSWALPHGWDNSPAKSVRIVAVSSDEPATCLPELFMEWSAEIGGNRRIHRFTLPDTSQPAYTRCTLRCVPEEEISSVIKQATAEASGEQPHAVINFLTDFECGESSISTVEQPRWHDVLDARGRDYRLADDTSWMLHDMFSSSNYPCVLYHVPQPGLVPAHIGGYSAVHLVLPSKRYVEILDRRTHLPLLAEIVVSRRERLHMLSWACRTTTDPSKVLIYLVDSQQLTAAQWVQQGAEEQRTLVEGLQLEGFMASLISIYACMSKPLMMARIFAPGMQFIETAKRQLRVHGVATWVNHQGGDCFIMSGIPKDAFPIFMDCLQLLRYDVRLALLAATPSSSAGVAKVKCMLASMLAVAGMMDFGPRDRVDQSEQHQDILLAAGKWLARPIISTGHIWKCLALWVAASAREYKLEEDSGELFATQSGSVLAIQDKCVTADDIHRALLVILKTHGSEVEMPEMPEKLGSAEYKEIQMSLLSAYAHHLLVVHIPRWNLGESIAYCYSGDQPLEGRNGPLISISNDKRMGQHRPYAFGISTHFLRDSDAVSRRIAFTDWTWIPMDVLAEWLETQHTTELKDLLYKEQDDYENPDEPLHSQ